MDNISSNDTIPPFVVPQGALNVPMLKVTFNNESAYNAGLDTLLVSVKNRSGEDVADPSRIVERIGLVTGSGAFSADVYNENPIPVIVDQGFVVDSGDADTAYVVVDIAERASTGSVNIEIANSADVRFSTVDGDVPLGVVWIEGGDIAGYFKNTPFTIMSGNFSEYAHNYPNPFSSTTRIAYFLTEDAPVNIQIYDYTGQLVWTRSIPAGAEGASGGPGRTECEIEWDGRNDRGELVRNGIYICKITAGSNSAMFKIAVAK
jgi:hypothetical protein